jgi:hypothetical protein
MFAGCMSKWECAEGFLPFVTARLELRWQRSHVQRARAARYTQGMPRCQFRNSCAIGVPSTPLPLIALFLYHLRTPPPAEATPVALLVRTELLMRTVELAPLERIPFWIDGRAINHEIDGVGRSAVNPAVDVTRYGAVPYDHRDAPGCAVRRYASAAVTLNLAVGDGDKGVVTCRGRSHNNSTACRRTDAVTRVETH